MFEIEELVAREILDSRGQPTLEVDCLLQGGVLGRAGVPAGISAGQREAAQLRDREARFRGRGVRQAIEAVDDEIHRVLCGMDARDQVLVDRTLIELDGTPDKSRLGANTLLGVSLAVAKAAAEMAGLPLYRYLGGPMATLLPVPMMNMLCGGAHANNTLDLQELMIVPMGFETFSEALRAGCEVYEALRQLLDGRGLSTAVGDDGGFAPNVQNSRAALDLLMKAIETAGYEPGAQVALALDVAASGLVEGTNGQGVSYGFLREGRRGLHAPEMIALYREWRERYPIVSIEDGLAESDLEGWHELTDQLGDDLQLVGDDLFVTNPQLLAEGIAEGIANSLLVKLDQVGTLSEAMKAVEMAKINSYTNVISHRSGETEDTFIADLTVATQAGQIKTGAPCRGDRVAKYNRLLRIEEELEDAASFPGASAFPRSQA